MKEDTKLITNKVKTIQVNRQQYPFMYTNDRYDNLFYLIIVELTVNEKNRRRREY